MKPAWVIVIACALLGVLFCAIGSAFFVPARCDAQLDAHLQLCRGQSLQLGLLLEEDRLARGSYAGLQGAGFAALVDSLAPLAALGGTVTVYDAQGALLLGEEMPFALQAPAQGMLVQLQGGVYATAHRSGTLLVCVRYDITPLLAQRSADWAAARWACVGAGLLFGALAAVLLILVRRDSHHLERAMRRFIQGHWEERLPARPGDLNPELTRVYNDLADAQEEKVRALEQVARQREDFVASFAHELKTPLTSIIGYADMLRLRRMESEQVFKAAGFIFSEGKRLEGLSLKLMDLIVMRRQVFDRKRISTGALAEDIRQVVTPMLEEHGLHLRVSVQESILYAEPDLLKTMLMNLIDNARKASAAGSEIFFSGTIQAGGYTFAVQDHGRGIPKEELNRITEAFYMVDKSRARAQNGAGLGLALCQEIAKLHGSRLEFESEEGKGTTVRVTLGEKSMPGRPAPAPRRRIPTGRRK